MRKRIIITYAGIWFLCMAMIDIGFRGMNLLNKIMGISGIALFWIGMTMAKVEQKKKED